MTYADKLRDPRWQKKRLDIFTRDNWTCLECGNKKNTLNVHHIIYLKRDPWDYPNQLLQTFCELCHKEREELIKQIIDAVKINLSTRKMDRLKPGVVMLRNHALKQMVFIMEGEI
jgi:hypothetical protein